MKAAGARGKTFAGRKERLARIIGHIATENTMMKRVSEEVGFGLRFDEDDNEWFAEIKL